MNIKYDEKNWWAWLFLSLLLGYCFAYAPYGINETDGGFLTGLAWQVLNGKALYRDIVYVRPPLPVWMRAGELILLPEQWAILGERWIFYFKVGLYSWLCAAVLTTGSRRWILAIWGFVISVHCYPATAWHTIDGILFSAIGFWLLFGSPGLGMNPVRSALAGIALFGAMLCKQSFYPLIPVFFIVLILSKNKGVIGWGTALFLLCNALFFSFLYINGSLTPFLELTGGASSGGQAVQHGVLDYFRIQPVLIGLSLVLLAPVVWFFRSKTKDHLSRQGLVALSVWVAWLMVLATSFIYAVWKNQDFTAPFAQSRLLFDLSVLFGVWAWMKRIWAGNEVLRFFALLAVTWCASVSWGYNLPILFAAPYAYAGMEMWRLLKEKLNWDIFGQWSNLGTLAYLVLLLSIFRYGYEFIYRDGRRTGMTENLGRVFPQLEGIYSDTASAALYLDLKTIASKYSPNFKTLPAFPQASYLCKAYPPLPLDWVVQREMNAATGRVQEDLQTKKLVLFVEKRYRDQIETDPELAITRTILHQGKIIEETPHFWVLVNY